MSADVIGVFVPIVAITMGIGLAMLSEFTSYRRRSQALAQRHAERLAAIEKGIDLPPDAGDPEAQIELAKALRQPRYLLRGLVYGGIGAALVLTWPGGEHVARTAGWVLAAIGVAHLIYYAVEGRKERASPPPGATGSG